MASSDTEAKGVQELVVFVTDIHNCARCGQDHPRLIQKPFERPPSDRDGYEWTHWATCPISGDPILMRVTDAPA